MNAIANWPRRDFDLARYQAQRQHLTLMPELERAVYDVLHTRELVLLTGRDEHTAIDRRREILLELLREYQVLK